MKSLGLVLLMIVVVVLLVQNQQKDAAMARAVAEREAKERDSDWGRQIAKLREQLRKSEADRDTLVKRYDRVVFERDKAREELKGARAEIAQLTSVMPRPQSWLEERLKQSARLDPPTSPGPSTGRPLPPGR